MTQSLDNPYLSVVVYSRNDSHGENMLQRMQASLSGLLEQLERHRIESEFTLVDWNPPPGKPPLRDVVEWPTGLKYCTMRVIEVSPSIHQRYKYHDRVPVHATVSFNCGIRRSRGQFILPGTIDLLYSDELMSFIASKKLEDDHRYRIDRCDVDRNVVELKTLREQLAYCEKNVIRRNHFVPGSYDDGFPRLHTNACGDFQLMSRNKWHLLRGYREADIVAAHVDSLLSYASYAAGVKEVILNDPMRLYHIDHDSKFNQRLSESKPLFEELFASRFVPRRIGNRMISLYRRFFGYRPRSRVYGIPTISHSDCLTICREMVGGKRPYICNGDNWGLGGENLAEIEISRAQWDRGPVGIGR